MIHPRLADLRSAIAQHRADGARMAHAAAEHRRATVDLEGEVRALLGAVRRQRGHVPLRDGDPGSEAPSRDATATSLRDYAVADRHGVPRDDPGPAFDRWALARRGEGLLRG